MKTHNSQFTRIWLLVAALLLAVGCSKEDQVAKLESRAKAFYDAGELEKAKITYLSILQQAPGNVTALRQLGKIWTEQGVPLRARPYLLRMRQVDPKDAESRYQLAVVARTFRAIDEARAEAMAVLELVPTHGEALILLAESCRTREEMDATQQLIDAFPAQESADRYLAEVPFRIAMRDALGANELVDRAVAADPKLPRVLVAQAAMHMARNDMDAAEKAYKEAAELSPPRSPQRLHVARFIADRGRVDEAIALLQEMGKKTPDYVPIWTTLGGLLMGQNRYDEALAVLDKVLPFDPEHFQTRLMQADGWVKKRDFPKAIELLKKLEQMHPGQPEVKYQLARAQLQNGSPEEAAVSLRSAITLRPDYPEAIFMLAQIDLRSGRPEEVVPAMRKLLETRKIPRAAIALADALQLLGRHSEAVEMLTSVAASDPDNVNYRLRLSQALAAAGKPDEARSAVEKALEVEPGHPGAVSRLVDMDLVAKSFDSAQARVDALLAKSPDLPAAQVIQARIHVVQEKWAEAEAALRKAIEASADEPGANELLIQVLRSSGKGPEALQIAEAVLARVPDDEGVLRQAGLLHVEQGQHEKAVQVYEKIRSTLLLPDPLVLNNLALLYSAYLNQGDKGYELARQARELRPSVAAAPTLKEKLEAASIADTLGWMLYRRGEYAQALSLIQEAAGFLSGHAEVQYHLGMAAAAMGQDETARTALALAVAGTPEFPGQSEARDHFRLLGGADGTKVAAAEIIPLVEKAPADVALQLRLAEAHEREAKFPEAVAAYAAALARNSALPTAAKKLAELYAGPLNDPAKAEENARKARQLLPNDAEVAALLGRLVFASRDHEFAYDLLREATRNGVRDPATLSQLAHAAYSLGNLADARTAMQGALAAGLEGALAEDARTFLSLTAGEGESGPDLAAAEAALQKDPRSVPALMIRGASRLATQDAKSAQADFEAALAVFPAFHPAKVKLASLLAEDPATHARAYELATQLRSALPEDPVVAELLARLTCLRKDYAYALQLFEESARQRPLDARALYYQGVCQRETGDKEASVTSIEQAIAAGLADPLATEAKAALEALKAQ